MCGRVIDSSGLSVLVTMNMRIERFLNCELRIGRYIDVNMRTVKILHCDEFPAYNATRSFNLA